VNEKASHGMLARGLVTVRTTENYLKALRLLVLIVEFGQLRREGTTGGAPMGGKINTNHFFGC